MIYIPILIIHISKSVKERIGKENKIKQQQIERYIDTDFSAVKNTYIMLVLVSQALNKYIYKY
jgi:hypothetical protein